MENNTAAAVTKQTTKVEFEITHQISNSKGWGRYKALTAQGPLVRSRTGNEWISAPHAADVAEGAAITVTLQTMQRAGKAKRENINSYVYIVVAESGATCELGHFNGLQVAVSGGRLQETCA